MSWLEQVQADEFGDRYLWRDGLTPLPSWKSKVAKHAAKRKAAKLYPNPSESKKLKIDVPLKEKPVSDLRTVRMVDYSDDEDPTRRVVFRSEDELSKVSAEGSGPSPPTPELDSAMGIWRRIDLSNEINCDRDKSSQGLIASKSKSLTEGSGSAPATLELDSTMGVGSRIDFSKEDC